MSLGFTTIILLLYVIMFHMQIKKDGKSRK